MNDAYPKRGDVYWVSLDPTIGSEINKTRPCVILSNNAQNKMSSRVIIAPITSQIKAIYPFETEIMVNGKIGKAMLDQIKCVDKRRLRTLICKLNADIMSEIERALKIVLGFESF